MALLPRRTAASTANSAVCSGGNAIVYEATDRETGEKWALKVIDRAVVTLEDSNQVAHAFCEEVTLEGLADAQVWAHCRPSC